WELAVVVDRFRAGLDLAFGEIPNQLADLLLFRVEGQIHLVHADDGGLALRHPRADAGRAVTAAPLAQRIDEVLQDARAGSADRMADRERAAIDVDPLLIDPEQVHGGTRHRGEG